MPLSTLGRRINIITSWAPTVRLRHEEDRRVVLSLTGGVLSRGGEYIGVDSIRRNYNSYKISNSFIYFIHIYIFIKIDINILFYLLNDIEAPFIMDDLNTMYLN